MALIRLPTWAFQKPPLGSVLNREHPLSHRLERCLLLNEGGGLFALDIAGGVQYAVAGTPKWPPTLYGPGCEFQTLGDNLQPVSGSPTMDPDQVTVEVWFRRVTAQTAYRGVSYYTDGSGTDKALYCRDDTNKFVWYIFDGGVNQLNSTTTITTGQWYHIVCSADGTTMRLYLNGVEDASKAGGRPQSFLGNFVLGVSGNEQIFGQYLLARTWHRALTPAEVAWLYAEPYAMIAPPAPTQRWWAQARTTDFPLLPYRRHNPLVRM